MNQLKNQQRVAIFIFDNQDRLIFSPYKDHANIFSPPKLTARAKLLKSFFGEDSDYIGIKLSRALAEPLRFANERSTPGQSVYVLGHPACTACMPEDLVIDDKLDFADRSPAPNSNGKGLKVSYGKVIAAPGLEPFFEMIPGSLQLLELRNMVFHTADSHHGVSGGPTLNSRGEVVAIHGGGRIRMIHGKLTRISRGSRP